MQVMTEYKTFGEHITELYQANHYTREEIANVLLVTPERMMEIERGVAYPNEQESFLLENILHIDIARLKRGEVVMRKTDEEIEAAMSSILEYLRKTQKNIDEIRKVIGKLEVDNSMVKDSEKLRSEKVKADNLEELRSKKVKKGPGDLKLEKQETAGLKL